MTTDLRPQSEIVYMRKEDTWVFQFLFRKIEDGIDIPVALDVSSYDFIAQLHQKVDKNWQKFPTPFGRKAGSDTANAIETGIRLGENDPSKITFLWDFTNSPDTNELDDGEYRLDFKYTTEQGYDKSFYSYFVNLNGDVRDDNFTIIAGVKYILAKETNSTIIHIHNTVI